MANILAQLQPHLARLMRQARLAMAGRRFFAIVALSRWSVAAAEIETGCNLESWLSNSPAPGGGEDGFHVVCALSAITFHIYKAGVATASPVVVELGDADLRSQFTTVLQISEVIKYHGQGKAVAWPKQPWVFFTSKGKELRPGSEAKVLEKQFGKGQKPVVLLLLEGGAWRWPTIRIGYERQVMPGIVLRTVARQPGLFELVMDKDMLSEGSAEQLSPNLLSNAKKLAENQMEPSTTEGKYIAGMRSSTQTFLNYNTDNKLKMLRAASAKLFRSNEDALEHLQVLRYDVGQHYDAHRDYWDPREFPDVPRFTGPDGFWHQRHATLLWYLDAPDEGGETWFPRAHGGPVPYDEWMACDSRGAKVFPANATAVLFYSLRADGDIDEYSWHCGCPVTKGTKWAANSWQRNSPEGRPRPWLVGKASNIEL